MPYYSVFKQRIPHTHSYPLKRSVLDAALLAAGITGLRSVYYSHGTRSELIALASFTGEVRGEINRDLGFTGTTSLTFYAVPRGERPAVEDLLVREGMALLLRWLKKAEGEGNVWRAVRHHLYLYCNQDELRTLEE